MGRGDYLFYFMIVYLIELNAVVFIFLWDGKMVCIMLEEDVLFDGELVWYIDFC